MDIANEGLQKCSGRAYPNVVIGSCRELPEVPEWRKPSDYPMDQRVFEQGETIFYCAEHEEVARRAH
jgi:hypothetical protein